MATCPSLAITTLAGSGMIGPAAPLVALLTGALLGGVAGGTAGGVYTCKVELLMTMLTMMTMMTISNMMTASGVYTCKVEIALISSKGVIW